MVTLLLALIGLGACVPALVPPDLVDNPSHDWDGDGYTEDQGDCDDADADALPGGVEVCGDGSDNDCDGSPGACGWEGEVPLEDAGPEIVVGEERGDMGWSVGSLPDIDENGASELLVGIPGFHRDTFEDIGTLLVRNGPVDDDLFLAAGTWQPPFESAAGFGSVVGTAGDFDGDGRVDALCTAPDYEAGLVGVFTSPLRTGTWGYAEGEELGEQLGAAAVAAGDLDGDGKEDLLAGAPERSSKGALVVVFGTTSAFPETRSVSGEASRGELGAAVAAPGDLDGDGYPDLVGGAPGADRVYVLGGLASKDVAVEDVGIRLDGPADSRAGASVASAGDVDGDGRLDLAVGAPGRGRVYVMLSPLADGAELEDAWAVVDGAGEEAGAALSTAADYDNDGVPDLVVGAPGSDRSGDDAGAVFVYGHIGPGTVAPADADLLLLGTDDGERAGTSVGTAGDIDGDGFVDLAVGAPYAVESGVVTGRVYLVLGAGGY